MQSKAKTVQEYLAELPEDRRAAISALRKVIRANLDKGFEEGMQYGMIGYFVPHRLYPNGYHCDPKQPLPFASLASQKNHMAVYLMSVYADAKRGTGTSSWFEEAWKKTGKKLDMGQCCVRFKKLEDVALDVIGEAVSRMSAQDYIAYYEANLPPSKKKASKKAAGASAKPKSAKKPATKRAK